MKNIVRILPLVILLFTSGKCGESDNQMIGESKTDAATKNGTQTSDRMKVKISTPFGDMIAELYNETPQHRDNFIKLVEEGYYNDLLFHRVISGFMIQGGDPESRGATPDKRLGSGGPGYTIEAEILPEFYHKKGALSAARTGDGANPERRSSGSQFYVVQGRQVPGGGSNAQYENQLMREFINKPENTEYQERLQGYQQMASDPAKLAEAQKKIQELTNEVRELALVDYEPPAPSEKDLAYQEIGGTPHLDGAYTVFGEVIEGLDIIDRIAAVKTAPGDRPIDDVTMTITIIE